MSVREMGELRGRREEERREREGEGKTAYPRELERGVDSWFTAKEGKEERKRRKRVSSTSFFRAI